MIGALVGGGLGLIGVISTIVFSYKLDKSNKKFQIEQKNKEKKFELELKELEKNNMIWFEKYKLLIQLMSFKNDISSIEFTSAINGVPALFHDSDDVMKALNDFYELTLQPYDATFKIVEGKRVNERDVKLIELINSLYVELDLGGELDRESIERVFNTHKVVLSTFELQHLATLSRIADTMDTNPYRKQ